MKPNVPRGCMIEDFTGNDLFVFSKSALRKEDVYSRLGYTGTAPNAISFRKCLSIKEEKIKEIKSFNLLTFLVICQIDQTIRINENTDFSNKSAEKKFISFRVSDLRDRFAYLRVYGSDGQLNDLKNAVKIDQLWGIKNFTFVTTNDEPSACDMQVGVVSSERILVVDSPSNMLQIGLVYGVKRCIGQLTHTGVTCTNPIDPSYHDKYCEFCEKRAKEKDERSTRKLQQLEKTARMKRRALDMLAESVDLSENERCSKAPKTDDAAPGNTFFEQVSEQNHKNTDFKKLISIAQDLRQYVQLHRNAQRINPSALKMLKALVDELTLQRPSADLLLDLKVTQLNLLKNLELAASIHRKDEIGVEVSGLLRVLRFRIKKHTEEAKKQPPKENDVKQGSQTQNSDKELMVSFENLQRAANGEQLLRAASVPQLESTKKLGKTKQSHSAPPSGGSGIGKVYRNEEELKKAIAACLAKDTLTV